jgi:NAD(P)-dependent dehydrogenase (short-subunit alcohol dehydrogenase family)
MILSKIEDNQGAALVTGGGKRIGREIALMLGHTGRPVVVHFNHSKIDADQTVNDINATGGHAVLIQADLSEAEAAASLITMARHAVGLPITCLINNASIFEPDHPGTFTSADFDRNMDIHARAPALLAKAMAAQAPPIPGGVIINLLDQKSFNPDPSFFSYTISKYALLGLTEILARALAPSIRVNGVALGLALAPPEMTDARFQELQARLPLDNGATPADVLAAVKFLVETKSVTGEIICVDGGEHMGTLGGR